MRTCCTFFLSITWKSMKNTLFFIKNELNLGNNPTQFGFQYINFPIIVGEKPWGKGVSSSQCVYTTRTREYNKWYNFSYKKCNTTIKTKLLLRRCLLRFYCFFIRFSLHLNVSFVFRYTRVWVSDNGGFIFLIVIYFKMFLIYLF